MSEMELPFPRPPTNVGKRRQAGGRMRRLGERSELSRSWMGGRAAGVARARQSALRDVCTSRIMTPTVLAVHRSPTHTFSKASTLQIRLIVGLGVEGDAHAGAIVKHRYRVARDPTQPNLRQAHLIHAELHDKLNAAGFKVGPGDMGEKVTRRGLDLRASPTGALLRIGSAAMVKITGPRNPCVQRDRFSPGLMQATLDCDAAGNLIRKAGVMGVVLVGG